MPRPAIKRNRLPKTPLISSKEIPNSRDNSKRNDRDSKNNAVTPISGGKHRTEQQNNVSKVGIAQQSTSHTPTPKLREYSVGPSPTENHLATGGRPNTRARGYSSTLSLGGRKGDMGSRVPGTPAFESSILSNFRRRPRQPSMLQVAQIESGSSDLDDDDFLGGLSPEDESTPLNLARGKSLIARRDKNSRSESSVSPPSTGGSRKRKRVREEFQVSRSPSCIVENTQSGSQASDNHDNEDASAMILSQSQSLEGSETFSQTMAAPLSSSPLHTSGYINKILQTGFDAEHPKETTPVISGPMHLPTQALQDRVLPRRRQRPRKHRSGGEDFEVPSDEDDDDGTGQDDDELSYLPLKPLQSQRKQVQRSKGLGRGTKGTTRKQSSTTSGSRQPCARRTYSSHGPVKVGTDKENRGGHVSESSPPLNSITSEELKSQARKFAEIDKWQMDFEDVVISGSQASLSG